MVNCKEPQNASDPLCEFCNGKADLPDFPWVEEIITVVLTIILIILCYFVFFKLLNTMKHYQAWFLVTFSIILSAGTGFMSFFVHQQRYGDNGSFGRWINSLDTSPVGIAVGGVTMLVFGFMDNAGLFFGSTYLDEVFEMFPQSDDANCFAGQGNTQSDFLGAFLGTFCGQIIADIADKDPDESPLYIHAIALVLGCLIGIIIPKLILGEDSDQHGINKINAKQALLGNLEEDEVYEIIINKKKAFDQRTEKIFKTIDTDESNTLEKTEIKEYLIKALGEAYSDNEFDIIIRDFFDNNKSEKKDRFNYDEFKNIQKEMAKQMIKEGVNVTEN